MNGTDVFVKELSAKFFPTTPPLPGMLGNLDALTTVFFSEHYAVYILLCASITSYFVNLIAIHRDDLDWPYLSAFAHALTTLLVVSLIEYEFTVSSITEKWIKVLLIIYVSLKGYSIERVVDKLVRRLEQSASNWFERISNGSKSNKGGDK